MNSGDKPHLETAVLGGGCFWCLEAVFAALRGVASVEPGYAGGTIPTPTYRQVCAGDSGHAEVVQIRFDPAEISYRDLLAVFFAIHDPTTLDRQGNDVGSQYRSVIFHHSPEQAATAAEVIAELERQGEYASPIVTQIEPCPDFYRAENYHLDYYARNGEQPYCRAVIAPKLAKLRRLFPSSLKDR